MKKVTGAGVIACMLFASGAQAAITGLDGQAGGALVPWALLSSGPTVAVTHLGTQNLGVNSVAANTSFANRVEVSYAHTMLDVTGSALGGANNTGAVDNLGLKVKLNDMGDLMPQFALGTVYKKANGDLMSNAVNGGAPLALGISTSSADFYGAASKIVNVGGKTVLLNGVLRATKANQMGLLGFGGGSAAGAKTGYSVEPELSAELFAADNVIVGAEYRAQPSNGVAATNGALHQNSAYDLHIVYVANKNFTLTAAYANLGQVAPGVVGSSNKQNGMLVQAQVNF